MAFVAAKNSVVKLANAAGTVTDISAYVDSVSGLGNSTDMLDATVLGNNSKAFFAGLRNGDTISVSGKWDSVLNTLVTGILGATKAFEYHPAGTAASTPKVTCNVLVASYEVSSSVADLVKFSLSLQVTGDVTHGTN